MAEPKEQEFLDDIADVEAEQDADEMIDIDEAAAEFDEIDALRAERDEYKDRFMRPWQMLKIHASVQIKIVKRPKITADRNWPVICCLYMTT